MTKQTEAPKAPQKSEAPKAKAKETITLVGRDGKEFKTTDRTEAVNLRARGYRIKK